MPSIAGARVGTPTVTGTQDITSAALGSTTPKAALFIMMRTTTNGTSVNVSHMGFGATDGVRQWCSVSGSQNGVDPSVSRRVMTTTKCVRILNSNPTGVNGEAQFDSFIPGGVRLNWTNAPNLNYLLTVVFFAGSGGVVADTLTVGAQDVEVNYTGAGFQPKLVLVSGNNGLADNTFLNSFRCNFGAAYYDGVSVTSRCLGMLDTNNKSPTTLQAYLSTQYVNMQLSASGFSYGVELANFDSQGFSAFARAGASNDDIGFLALELPNDQVWLGSIDSPTTTGLVSQTGLSFTPEFLMLLTGMLSAQDTLKTNAEGGTFATSVITSSEQYTDVTVSRDNIAPSSTKSISDAKAVDVNYHTGADRFDATFSSFNSDGWTLNYSLVDATVRKWFGIAIGQVPGIKTAVNEAVDTSESSALNAKLYRAIGESLSNSEVTSSAARFLRMVSEVLDTSEAPRNSGTLFRQLVESLSASESAIYQRGLFATIVESLSINAGQVAVLAVSIVQALTEAISASEAASTPLGLSRPVDEQLQLTELGITARRLLQPLVETVQTGDAVAISRALSRTLTELLQSTELAAETKRIAIALGENISAAETSLYVQRFIVTVAETMRVSQNEVIRTAFLLYDAVVGALGVAVALAGTARIIPALLGNGGVKAAIDGKFKVVKK